MARRKLDPSVREQALKLVAEGVSKQEVATRLGVSLPSVYNWLKAEKPAVDQTVTTEQTA
jgi:transposase